jgi:AraC family transcriptional regulator, glycine betaine-responsive activator
MSKNVTSNLGFLIFPGFPMSCLTSAIEPLRAANEIAGVQAFDWQLLSEDGQRVASSARVSFEPDAALGDAGALDYLLLLSGPQGRFADERAGNAVLRLLARRGVHVGGVSGGVFPLVRSGVMEGHRCSVHWCYAAAFSAEFPQMQAEDDVIVVDRRRLTASGAAAAFDLMLRLIEARLGPEVMTEVACWFQHPLVRGEGVSQKIPTFRTQSTDDMLPPQVVRAIRIFGERIADPVTLTDVADEIGISARQMERKFKKATGQSPLRYYRMLRMKAARQLVMYSNDSMTEIAWAVGYASSSPMVQHYRETFGISPKEEREKINLFRVKDNRPLPAV